MWKDWTNTHTKKSHEKPRESFTQRQSTANSPQLAGLMLAYVSEYMQDYCTLHLKLFRRLCEFPVNCQSKGDPDYSIITRNPSVQVDTLTPREAECPGVRVNAALTQSSFTAVKRKIMHGSIKVHWSLNSMDLNRQRRHRNARRKSYLR